ncbi:MAG: RtcB family protein [Nanoarchaeota archaeon]|nr:RtcB family protein [Nanoarchaeota archaeon]
MVIPKQLQRIGNALYELPTSYKQGMHVPARFVASPTILKDMDHGVFDQTTNVACLPGIVKHAYCMPDGHWGYGFPIGGVAAFDVKEGIISPGGVGFDINCGMRLIRTNLTYTDVKPKIKDLINTFFRTVPAGVGVKGFARLNTAQLDDILTDGTQWCVDNGYGWQDDVEHTESNGKIPWADPATVSDKAHKRGKNQLGTLGSGNHYLELQVAKEIFDKDLAAAFGITDPNQVMVMVHTGSRGIGHQICTDSVRNFDEIMRRYHITVPDRELACVPFQSDEGQTYYKAMACAANFAYANRQVVTHRIREGFSSIFKQSPEALGLHLIYDVTHNMAKLEEHDVDGKKRKLVVHRKGSTRAFGPGHPELTKQYQKTGQPIIIGGSMETGSALLVGTEKAMELTFGSTCHGSGRTMSRTKAKKLVQGDQLQQDMEKRGIYVKSASAMGLAEEAGMAYKNITDVVASVEQAGISKLVANLKPIGNVKG